MPKLEPLLDLPAGTKLTSLVPWTAQSDRQLTVVRDEEVTFESYWEKGNYWMKCRKTDGATGLLRTDFLAAELQGDQLEVALAKVRERLPAVIKAIQEAPLTDGDVADPLVEVPVIAVLAQEMYDAGACNVLCSRIGRDELSLKELKWGLGSDTGVLAFLCNFVDAAREEVVKRKMVPLFVKRARGLITGDGQVGVNSPAGQSIRVLAALARNQEHQSHVRDKETVKTILKILCDKGSAQHKWNKWSCERKWSAHMAFAWCGEFVSGLALHELGRKALRNVSAVKMLKTLESDIEGAAAKDYGDGTAALLEVPEQGTKVHRTWSRKVSKSMEKKGMSGYIMISYSWQTQPLALKIKKGLEDAGFQIWIDLDKMEGNIMLRMSQAVEGAAAVVLLYSQKYADSRHCNMESQYVAQLDKQFVPVICEQNALRLTGDGGKMLNFLRGTKLYVDMSDLKQFDQKLPELVRGVRSSLRAEAGTDSQHAEVKSSAMRIAELETEVQNLKDRLSQVEALVQRMASGQ